MAKKTYTIKVNSRNAQELLRELDAWGVRKSRYQVLLITQDTNVVDVTTETFMRRRERFEIMETAARRPLDDHNPNGYLESDRDFVLNNIEACAWFLERTTGRALTISEQSRQRSHSGGSTRQGIIEPKSNTGRPRNGSNPISQ